MHIKACRHIPDAEINDGIKKKWIGYRLVPPLVLLKTNFRKHFFENQDIDK